MFSHHHHLHRRECVRRPSPQAQTRRDFQPRDISMNVTPTQQYRTRNVCYCPKVGFHYGSTFELQTGFDNFHNESHDSGLTSSPSGHQFHIGDLENANYHSMQFEEQSINDVAVPPPVPPRNPGSTSKFNNQFLTTTTSVYGKGHKTRSRWGDSSCQTENSENIQHPTPDNVYRSHYLLPRYQESTQEYPQRLNFNFPNGQPSLSRSVSCFFENLPSSRTFVPVPADLGLPLQKFHISSKKLSASEQQLFQGVPKQTSPRNYPDTYVGNSECILFSSTNVTQNPVILINGSCLTGKKQHIRREYWKVPPLPFVPSPEPYHYPESPTQLIIPKQQWRKKHEEDPSLMLQGKTSPGLTSLTSRDSDYSEMTLPGKDMFPDENKNVSNPSISQPESFRPGFSCKNRRTLFRAAMCELEDTMKHLQSDVDLLDRAERRDLPTVHQELIANGRKGDNDWENHVLDEGDDTREIRPRQRAPPVRRSAIPDKKLDDMAFRICQSNNRRPVYLSDPASTLGHRHFNQNPELPPCSSYPLSEPDPVADDVHLRSLRDSANFLKTHGIQSKFGIPSGPIVTSSSTDYLHAIPTGKYKSTFNAMKIPDTFQDDMAVRNLRKDSFKSEPNLLGIYKDPNISSHSCWQHKAQERLSRRSTSPLVFRPTKNNELIRALSEKISLAVQKQSRNPSAKCEPDEMITYDDLLRDPSLMKTTRRRLLHCTEEELEEMSKRPEWSGKTVFRLLSNTEKSNWGNFLQNHPTERIVGKGSASEHLFIENCLTKQNQKNTPDSNILSCLENDSSSFLRSLERDDSGGEEDLNTLNPSGMANFKADDKIFPQTTSNTPGTRGEKFPILLQRPGALAKYYCIACLHQLTGLDSISSLGILMVMILLLSLVYL